MEEIKQIYHCECVLILYGKNTEIGSLFLLFINSSSLYIYLYYCDAFLHCLPLYIPKFFCSFIPTTLLPPSLIPFSSYLDYTCTHCSSTNEYPPEQPLPTHTYPLHSSSPYALDPWVTSLSARSPDTAAGPQPSRRARRSRSCGQQW